jgi:hypothetical protein
VRRIQCPTLLVRGAQSAILSREAAARFVRELPGILLVLFYVGVLPGILAFRRKIFGLPIGLKKYYDLLGPWRYAIFVMLLLAMIALPIKMSLRWLFNLKYIVALPEIFFNI